MSETLELAKNGDLFQKVFFFNLMLFLEIIDVVTPENQSLCKHQTEIHVQTSDISF